MSKPFLILQLRANDVAAEDELRAFLRFGGLKEEEVRRIRMEAEGIPEVNLEEYSGVIVGGGPANVSDDASKKDDAQKRFEADLHKLLNEVMEKDFPYFGACYGHGALVSALGGTVSKERFGEPAGPTTVDLTPEGKTDPLTFDLPDSFRVFCGHKEACQKLPDDAVLLVTSPQCPVQMIRVKKNIYGVQFHPELDAEGMVVRINAYKNAGYFPPEDAEKLIDLCRQERITVPTIILKRFVEKFKR